MTLPASAPLPAAELAPVLPLWGAALVVFLAVAGSALSLLGAVGLVRLRSFYERVHAPTLGATLGMILVLSASALYFALAQGRYLPRELLIGVFLTVTTPVTLILLARATRFRERAGEIEQTPELPRSADAKAAEPPTGG